MSSIPSPRAIALALALGTLLAASPELAPRAAQAAASQAQLSGVVNVNTANVEQLVMLPGIGESKAGAILASRAERGRFESLDELLEVKGIGERALERIRPFVTLEGKTSLAVQ